MFLQFCFLLLLYVHTHGHCQYVATETIGSLMNERGAAKKKEKSFAFTRTLKHSQTRQIEQNGADICIFPN